MDADFWQSTGGSPQAMDTKGNFEFEREIKFRRAETLLDLRLKK